jgi:hypothetical protein
MMETFIASIVFFALIMILLGTKFLLDRSRRTNDPECALDDGQSVGEDGACKKCKLKDLIDCPENNFRGNHA